MKNLAVNDEYFVPREVDFPPDPEGQAPCWISIKLRVAAEMAFRVYDEFEEGQVERNPDGSFTVAVIHPGGDWVWGYIMSFGSHAEVLEPEWAREALRERLQKSLERYL